MLGHDHSIWDYGYDIFIAIFKRWLWDPRDIDSYIFRQRVLARPWFDSLSRQPDLVPVPWLTFFTTVAHQLCMNRNAHALKNIVLSDLLDQLFFYKVHKDIIITVFKDSHHLNKWKIWNISPCLHLRLYLFYSTMFFHEKPQTFNLKYFETYCV